jgi:uncharacterized membrane protein required for colicin V production
MTKTVVQSSKSRRPALSDADLYSVAEAPAPKIYHPPAMPREIDMPRPSKPQGASALWAVMLVLILSVATYAWAAANGLLLFRIGAAVAAPVCTFAVWRGGIRKAVVLGTMLCLSMLWAYYPDLVAGVISSVAGQSSPIVAAIASSVLAGLVVLVASLMAKFMSKRLVGASRLRDSANRLLGLGLGLCETALVVLTLCWTAANLAPLAKRITDDPSVDHAEARFQVAEGATKINNEARLQGWAPFIHDSNPISKTPALQQLIDQLNESGRLDFDADKLKALLPTGTSQTSPEVTPEFLESLIEDQKRAASTRRQAYEQMQDSIRR